MYYFRRQIGNEWKDIRLGEDEAKKILSATATDGIIAMQTLDEAIKKSGVNLTPQDPRYAILLLKMAPTYTDRAVDYIMKKLKAEQDNKAKAPSASAQTAPAATAS